MVYKNPTTESVASAETATGAEYGSEYLKWKGWDAHSFGTLSKVERAYFSAEIRRSKTVFPPHCNILEIGFGHGSFLAFGSERQWDVQATEVNAALVELASQRGFRVAHTDNLEGFPEGHFDLVVAFDVLEHLPEEKVVGFMREIQRILKCGGVFIGRFPNGDSPFGRQTQHGDPTHITTIGSSKAQAFSKALDVELIYIGGAAQPLCASWSYFIYHLFTGPIRYVLNFFLNLLFSPRDPKAYCSTNLVMIFRKVKPVQVTK